MTELSFLIDLLLNHKLPKATKDAVAARIKDIEQASPQPRPSIQPIAAPQVAQVAQTPAAQAALAQRQALINEAMSGKLNKDTGRPNKYHAQK